MADDDLLDLDEDLFDFDELLRDVEQLTGGDLESGLDEAVGAAVEPPAPLPAEAGAAPARPVHRPHRRPPPVAPRPPVTTRPTAVAATTTVAAPAPQPPAGAVEPRRGFVPGRGTLMALGAVAVLHLAVLILVVQAIGAVRGMISEAGERAPTPEPVARTTVEPAVGTGTTEPVAPPSEGQAALERARELLQRGEHQRARETLYGLLAVIDRLPVEARQDVEARARFLVADTWRLEAAAAEELAALGSALLPGDEEERR